MHSSTKNQTEQRSFALGFCLLAKHSSHRTRPISVSVQKKATNE